MDKVCAKNMCGFSCGISVGPFLKLKSQHLSGLVFCSFLGTCRNSQLRRAKKRDPLRSCALALARGVCATCKQWR
jgi:hypothetical protein